MQPGIVGKVVSVNVGLPRTVVWKGRSISTGIFKEPVAGRVKVTQLNLEGDRQADLKVHGGPDKAIYVYPAQYYDFWREQYPDKELNWGMFGENLTITGLNEQEINIGDRFRIGTVEVIVTQPRMPCFKLGIKFDRDDILKKFMNQGYSGFYFRVVKEGELGAGDSVELLSQDDNGVKVADITNLYREERDNQELLKRALQVEALPAVWKDYFIERLYN